MHELEGCAASGPAGTGLERDIREERSGGSAERFILAAYLLWLSGSVLSVSTWKEFGGISDLSDLMRRTAHFLLLFEFLRRGSYTRKDAAGVFLLVFMGIVSEHSVHNSFVMPALLFVLFSARVRFRLILKATLLFHVIFMAVTVTASQAGIIEDLIWYDGGRVRHSLGYIYCGYPAHFLLFMMLMWLCIRRRPRVADAAVLLLANWLMYRFTDSRTDFLLGIFAVAGAFLWTANFRSRPLCALRGFLARYGAAAAAVGSIAAHYFYDPGNPFLARVNLALNNRLQFGLDAILNYGFSLFGKEIRWVGQGSLQADPTLVYNYVDCAFLKDGLTFGLLFLLLLLVGFYLEGKRLDREGRHMESWAMMVSLAYAVFNAHLCVLYFNVFLLLLGENFADAGLRKTETVPHFSEVSVSNSLRGYGRVSAGEAVMRENVIRRTAKRLRIETGHMEENVGKFADVLGSVIPVRLRGEHTRRTLRTMLFLALGCYVIAVQCLPTAYAVRTAGVHMWMAAGVLLIFSALCAEQKTGARENGPLFRLLLLFLIMAGLSDLVLNKRFRNAPFVLLVFGGLFLESWKRMRTPRQLLEEFRWACGAGFVLALLYCIAARPAVPGIRYSGFLPASESYGAVMTVFLAVFLSGMHTKGTGKRTVSARENVPGADSVRRRPDFTAVKETASGIGAVTALYLIWLTQERSAVLTAAAVLTVYAGFWIYGWSALPGKEKFLRLLQMSVIAAAGLSVVLLLRPLLYQTAPALGTQLVYDSDKNKLIGAPLQESLLSVQKWSSWFAAKWKNCAAYLRDLNLTGHYYRARYRKKEVWAANSLVINLYRYGAAAGGCYGLLLLSCLWKAVRNTLRRKDFLPAGLAVSCFAAGMTAVTELPFINLNWMIFYFVLAWLLEDEDGGHEIFKYGNRQSVL